MPPAYTFRTRRLTIRPLTRADFPACQRTKRASVLSSSEREGSVLAVSHDDVHSFGFMVDHRGQLMEQDRGYFFGMFRNTTGAFVGDMMLYDIERGQHQNCTVGTVVYSLYRRQGLGREGLRATFRYAFRVLGLHRVCGLANPDNRPSIAMCHAAGMRDEGISQRRVKIDGRWRDQLVLAITREEL